ncbi:hypothetical protein [Oerskovia flava]|uniref:hypothetical protein n=1 Tax=Oerskovia flava TaxID=2986422 RepID=UPI002240D299|nr:hypothetical protein [Oerskovia sp. JB1-3-2]
MSLIRDIVKQFDGSEELAQTQREVIESLARLGETKAELFDVRIQESLRGAGGTNSTVPITSILASKKEVHAFSSTSVEHLADAVKSSLKSFVAGTSSDIIDGVGTLVSEALTAFLGGASASTGTIEEYYVVTEGLSIVRVDLKAWYQNVSAKSIYEKMERVSAFVAVKSTVDLSKIDFNTFLYLYQDQLSLARLPKEQITQALKDAKEIYREFNEMGGRVSATTHITRPPAATAPRGR